MSTFLVTGARGNIGSRVVAKLAKTGARVQVAILGEVAGRRFEYVNVDDDAAVRGMLDAGVPRVMAEALIHLVQALRAAGHTPPSEAVPQILGRPARTFRQWAIENAGSFQGKAAP